MGILGVTGIFHDPKQQVYAWIAVFVLPINSSINPILYTLSTPAVKKHIDRARDATRKRLLDWFQSEYAPQKKFCKLTQNTV